MGIGFIFAAMAAPVSAVQEQAPTACSVATMEANLNAAPEVQFPASSAILQAPNDTQFVSTERRIPCTEATLLKLGFEVKTSWRAGPGDSTNAAYEEMTFYQKGAIAVRCYAEFKLSETGQSSKVDWTRYACQQVVPPRLRPKN